MKWGKPGCPSKVILHKKLKKLFSISKHYHPLCSISPLINKKDILVYPINKKVIMVRYEKKNYEG